MKPTKSEIFSVAIHSQKGIIHDLEKRVKDILANDGNVNEEEYDSTEQSIKSSLIDEADMLNEEIQFVKNELGELEKIKDHSTELTRVAPGAVIATNHGTFFASVSMEGFNIGKSHFFGLSIKSPLYQKMKGKKKGDKFKFKETEYEIKDVY